MICLPLPFYHPTQELIAHFPAHWTGAWISLEPTGVYFSALAILNSRKQSLPISIVFDRNPVGTTGLEVIKPANKLGLRNRHEQAGHRLAARTCSGWNESHSITLTVQKETGIKVLGVERGVNGAEWLETWFCQVNTAAQLVPYALPLCILCVLPASGSKSSSKRDSLTLCNRVCYEAHRIKTQGKHIFSKLDWIRCMFRHGQSNWCVSDSHVLLCNAHVEGPFLKLCAIKCNKVWQSGEAILFLLSLLLDQMSSQKFRYQFLQASSGAKEGCLS